MVDLPNLFPARTPVGRRYSFGQYPITTESVFGQPSVRFLHGLDARALSLELSYENLTQTEVASIRNHYRSMRGGYRSFQLPAAVWAGHSSTSNIVPTTGRWKYAAQPEEVQKRGGYVDVTVSLVSVS